MKVEKKLSSKISLDKTHPELAKEWHPTKNGDVKPNQIRPNTHTKRWWKCTIGHEWQQSLLSRTRTKNNQCSICNKK